MSDNSYVTNVPWAWVAVIEALAASPSVKLSVLLEVIEKAPDIPDNFGKTMKERLALLCLEDLFGHTAGHGRTTSCASDAKITIDPSKSCEDVLQHIVNELNYEALGSILKGEGIELIKWDLNSYINNKKLSIPKTALQQLKETLLKCHWSYADYLKEMSGLDFLVSQSVNKRKGIIEDRNTRKGLFQGEKSIYGSDDLHSKIRKVKDASLRVRHGEGTLPGREMIEDLSNRQAQVTPAEGCQLKVNKSGTSYEGNVSGNTDHAHVVSQMPHQSDIDGNKFHTEVHSRGNRASQDRKNNDEHRDDDHTSAEPVDGTLPTVSSKDFQGNCDLHVEAQKTVLSGILQQMEMDNRDAGISSDNCEHYTERVDVSEKKRKFLSSQCPLSYDTLSNTDCTEQSICMKCKKDGNLLICSGKDCIVVLHQRCIGFWATCDAKGNFYCPFCVSAHAHRDYKRAKKEVIVSRSKLSAFLSNGV